jgi:hypothetical protein
MHVLPFENIIDINTLYYINSNASYDYESLIPSPLSHMVIQRLFSEINNINKALPILKFYERLVPTSNKLEKIIKENISAELEQSFPLLNNDTIECLQKIEKEGLCIDRKTFLTYFPNAERHINDQNLVFTEYNPYTATGRPANKFGRINFAALKKETGERSSFISRFDDGELIMFDYDAYHLRLMANMINYEFPPNENIHEYLGKLYFGKDTLTPEEYTQSKEVSFQLIYGGIDKIIAEAVPFFGKVKAFIDSMWQSAQDMNYAETLISKKKIWLKNFDFLNRNKLFNYILQNYETEQNIQTIQKIQRYLLEKSLKSKLVLYLYDGFLFDVEPSERAEINGLRTIFELSGKFPTKMYSGKNFHNLIKID